MPREVMTWNAPTVRVALTQEALATAQAIECQITSATLTPQPQYQTIPATGCEGASQSPGRTGYNLELNWLQDWTIPDPGGLSKFAWDNDAGAVWAQIIHNETVGLQPDMVGQFFCTSGGFGGTFGDGSAASTSATWPAVSKPTITIPAAVEPELAEV